MFTQSLLWRVICGAFCLLPIACTGPQPTTAPPVTERERFPSGSIYKVGEPYQIKGVWYYPYEDYSYRETGIASWYGISFHGKETANGEVFDMNILTAAHRTLPIPSMVRVTNLANGRTLMVRVNDRGPFVNDRVIDLSRRAAQLLGFEAQGTTRVRVEILAAESLALKSKLLRDNMVIESLKVESAPRIAIATKPLELLPVPDSPPFSSYQLREHTALTASAAITATVSPPVPAQRTAERPMISDTSGYYIQVATFDNSTFAYRAFKQLERKGRVNLVLQRRDSRMLYRLHIGPLAEWPAAEQLLAWVRKAGYADAWIIRGEK